MLGLNKIKEAKAKADELKNNLEHMLFEEERENGMIQVAVNGNRKITKLKINESLLRVREGGEIEEKVQDALNTALGKAEFYAEQELKKLMPNIPGLNF
ncbi:MAG: nucleoid-associated protein, YbaB/EbfC family [Bacteroidetes bacterium MED-G17]|jgi:DNA-binding YbaB/EbfC family protein|nr:MAG: nucleoid-associated protein, YbaB/EbfC family [Bacteroidetes bacterium TMED39]PDH53251.1 MAG: nucleoid-associated protein, YbaB/EbfC family [Bacteroidetes bacterium MED-G17]CAI8287878.1 MAG: Nucleoid-associated protein YbaB [Bacteroidetes bacterium MED-G17]|tara:strand:+ start:8750 stop:9046 length:297 start_codon:yes stop_codon:yes gene_type:complete